MKFPGKEDVSPNMGKVKDEEIDWEYAQTELIDVMNQEKRLITAEADKLREKEGNRS